MFNDKLIKAIISENKRNVKRMGIYNYNPDECLEWDELEKKLSCPYSALEKLEYLFQLSENKRKNIFVHKH